MTKEVLQQALEALEATKGYMSDKTSTAKEVQSAIEALKSALAQQADYVPCYSKSIADMVKQGEQQPVAWMVTTEKQDGTRETYPITGRYKDVKDVCDFGEPIPLYAAAPAAQPIYKKE